MKHLKSEIIAVGTELLLGQIANTNAQWISEQLAQYGISVYYHGVVGDNKQRVYDTFESAQKRSDIVIVTGGLGPTEDDLTREAFQNVSHLDMIEHEPSMKKIKQYFTKQNKEMTPNNRKQARVFQGATVLENKVGMAPGMIVQHNETIWFFLPGVPREMKQLMNDNVIPYLIKTLNADSVIQSTILRFIGIGEAELEHKLQDLIKSQSNPTIAPLAQENGVIIRLTAKAQNSKQASQMLEKARRTILNVVGEFYYGSDHDRLEEMVVQLLKDRNITLSAAESLTGGMFTEQIISVPGASHVCPGGIVAYNEKVKQYVLGIDSKVMEQHGTVSEVCALEMAKGVKSLLNTDIGISFTGVAGPDQLEGQEVGTVFIAIQCNNRHIVKKFHLSGERSTIRKKAVLKSLELLFKLLKS